jgi:hypothetical protein
MGAENSSVRAAVLAAIDAERYDFRTIKGVAEETGVSREVVRGILVSSPERVRLSLAPGPHGELLYAGRDKSVSWRERFCALRQMMTLT